MLLEGMISSRRSPIVRDLALAGLRRVAVGRRRGGTALRRGRQPARARLVAAGRRQPHQVCTRRRLLIEKTISLE